MCDGNCALRAAGRAAPAGDDLELAGGGLSRRIFIARSTLAAVAAVLTTACGDGIIGGSLPTGVTSLPSGGLTLNVGDYPALATVGGIARADTVAGPIALVRTGTSAYSAFSMICPHQGSTINIQGAGFLCPNHGARFDAAGQWTGGQATSSLTAFPVAFDAATGVLTVGATTVPVPSQPGTPGTPGTANVNIVVDLTAFPALAQVGGVARVDNGGTVPVGAARIGASQFAAYSLVCTHQGSTVGVAGSGWLCPNHGARFDAQGNVTLGPATLPLNPLTATYDAAANTLTITGTATAGGGGGDDDDGGRGGRD